MSKTMYHVDSFGQWHVKEIVKTSEVSVWYASRDDPSVLVREARKTTGGAWFEDPLKALEYLNYRVEAAHMILSSRIERRTRFEKYLKEQEENDG